ncbi:MAG: metal ABC transporter substrate-binding protein [Dehalococcoidia bacterium]|nr:metal ABC transporter substrate-binding protein [Dehalococcoidia bacterium]
MMRLTAITKLGRLLPLVVVALLIACAGPQVSPGTGSKVRVAVSIPPLADLVRQVGGDRVESEVLVPPGASVEIYEPTPRQIQFVAQAQMLVLNGLGLEFWAGNVVKGSGNANLLVVNTSDGVPGLIGGEQGGGFNPHIWLDPTKARVQVEHIRDALIQTDPASAEAYRAAAAKFSDQLAALDQEIANRVNTWRYKQFIAFHPAWQYFAARYGLEQVASIEEFPGKEPSPQYLANIAQKARSLGAKAIFAEPQLSLKAAQTIASETGKEVLILDDLGGVQGRIAYEELMRYNVDQMEKALK